MLSRKAKLKKKRQNLVHIFPSDVQDYKQSSSDTEGDESEGTAQSQLGSEKPEGNHPRDQKPQPDLENKEDIDASNGEDIDASNEEDIDASSEEDIGVPNEEEYQEIEEEESEPSELGYSGVLQHHQAGLGPESQSPSALSPAPDLVSPPQLDPTLIPQIPPLLQQDAEDRGETEENKLNLTFLNNITISRDQTAKSNFRKELLAAIHDPEREETAQIDSTPKGNHALQDYQMQLMLLEQQNKKRLLMARQEQDNMVQNMPANESSAGPSIMLSTMMKPQAEDNLVDGSKSSSLPIQPLPSIPASISDTLSDFDFDSFLDGADTLKSKQMSPKRTSRSIVSGEVIAGAGSQGPSKRKYVEEEAPVMHVQERAELARRRLQPRQLLADADEIDNFQSDRDIAMEELKKRVAALEDENKALKNSPKPVVKPPRVQVFHVMDDEGKTTCLEPPTWTMNSNGRLELKAELPLLNAELYLQKNDDIIFVVYKWYTVPWMGHREIGRLLDLDTMPDPIPFQETMILRSDELRAAVDLFLTGQSSFRTEFPVFMPNQTIRAPYFFWYRYRTEIHTLSSLQPRHQLMMKTLIQWIEANYKPKYDQFEDQLSRGRISHEFIEFLFRTGEIVVQNERDQVRGFMTTGGIPLEQRHWGRNHKLDLLQQVLPDQIPQNKGNPEPWYWNVPCWAIAYDGEFLRRSTGLQLELRAETHSTEVDIRDLNIYPLRLASGDVQKQLRERGETFWSCRIKRFVAYQGSRDDTLNNDGERYMVDFASYRTLHLEKQGSKRTANSQDKVKILADRMESDEPPDGIEIYLFPPTIPAFSLRRKRWTDLVVDRMTNVTWNKNAFQYLVADDKTKELVQALVANRIAGERNTDLIQGKGNGLIMLLHGGPGTGKTFTAESVAEMAEKPLYPVTCGDIGTEPEQVEKYLESVLHMGKIWDCVVLLDEADVFLEERSMADLARNALVSVFLRVLEYYDGILVLTSNRVGTFDEAFKSRIQLALHYPSLNKSQRCKIWKNFFNRLKSLNEPDIDFDDIECSVTELAAEELNGRQIRNAITTSRQLAKFQGKALSYQHLQHVIRVSGQFEAYVKNTKEGLSDDQVARASGIRF